MPPGKAITVIPGGIHVIFFHIIMKTDRYTNIIALGGMTVRGRALWRAIALNVKGGGL